MTLTQELERRARLLQAANQVGKEVTQILNLDELLPKMVDIICDNYGFYYAGVFLIDDSGQWAVLRAGRGAAGKAMVAEGHRLQAGGHSMVGMAIQDRKARIAFDVGEERIHFKNPHLPLTRSEMAMPLVIGNKVLGAVTVQSVEERAFSEDDILTLQTMADHLAVAINNANTLKELERAHADLLRTKTYETLSTATTQAIHWIGNKALPITTAVERMKGELEKDPIDRKSLCEDLEMVEVSAKLIVEVKEKLLGPAREQKPRPCMPGDVAMAAGVLGKIADEIITINVTPGSPLALGDTTQLARAFENLYQNAVEAGARSIRVNVAPANEKGFISIDINDDGEGIHASRLNNIWIPFMSSRGLDHPGLGLPACLEIISQLHGHIYVTSQPGKGTTFHILLPECADAGQSTHVLEKAALPAGMLLIDNDDLWAHFAVTSLTSAGKTLRHELPGNLLKALEAEPKLILVDEALTGKLKIGMLLDQVKQSGLIDRVIILSAALNVERAATYLQMGVKDIALKPYTPGELAQVLS